MEPVSPSLFGLIPLLYTALVFVLPPLLIWRDGQLNKTNNIPWIVAGVFTSWFGLIAYLLWTRLRRVQY